MNDKNDGQTFPVPAKCKNWYKSHVHILWMINCDGQNFQVSVAAGCKSWHKIDVYGLWMIKYNGQKSWKYAPSINDKHIHFIIHRCTLMWVPHSNCM